MEALCLGLSHCLSLKEHNLEMKLDIQKDPYVSKVPEAKEIRVVYQKTKMLAGSGSTALVPRLLRKLRQGIKNLRTA